MIAEASHFRSSDLRSGGDGQIRAAAVAALNSAHYSALRNLNCRVVGGTAEITGTVPSFYLKQLAQTAVAQLPGVLHVRNLVVVRQ
jgi:hypothetical protein